MASAGVLNHLDYLVFSSHKTASRSFFKTFKKNGFSTGHCHSLSNLEMQAGDFFLQMKRFVERNGRQLKIVSIFRKPVERHISSFFQWYGTRPLRLKEVEHESETLIARAPIAELQRKLIAEIDANSLAGVGESIELICEEMRIDMRELRYDDATKVGRYENELCILYLVRFDELSQHLARILSRITGRYAVNPQLANLSSAKWYSSIRDEFTKSLVIPASTIRSVYAKRKALFEAFYPGEFQILLEAALEKYSI